MSFAAAVRAQLEEQRKADPEMKVFGSASHRYRLNPTLSEADVQSFETKYDIELPSDFREFVTQVGNGGAGPFYGLFQLGLFDATGRRAPTVGRKRWHRRCVSQALPSQRELEPPR